MRGLCRFYATFATFYLEDRASCSFLDPCFWDSGHNFGYFGGPGSSRSMLGKKDDNKPTSSASTGVYLEWARGAKKNRSHEPWCQSWAIITYTVKPFPKKTHHFTHQNKTKPLAHLGSSEGTDPLCPSASKLGVSPAFQLWETKASLLGYGNG